MPGQHLLGIEEEGGEVAVTMAGWGLLFTVGGSGALGQAALEGMGQGGRGQLGVGVVERFT